MSHITKFSKVVLPAALLLLAAACGGGGGGDGGSNNQANLDTGPGSIERPTPGQPSPNCTLRYTLTDLPAAGSGTDPRIGQQWFLQASGTNATSVWSTNNKGEGVRVAVVDDAIETVHEDLRDNVVPGASYNYRDASTNPLPCALDEDHGTAVAGIIAARDGNSRGGAGVAPRAALVGYNALSTSNDSDIADAMTRGRDLNQIVHNSWGSPDDGKLNPASAPWEAAVLDGIRTGRGGRGTVYMFASGNGGVVRVPRTDGEDNLTFENSNFDGFVNKLGVNAVCAVGQDGKSPYYAEEGANLLVCGPSSSTTPDIITTAIQNNYRTNFGFTSGATPMVSGVAALVLKANPNLTWRDVRLILAQSARKNDPQDSGWLDSALPGMSAETRQSFNHKYGFGTVDANAAVALAAGWRSVGGSSTLLSCEGSEYRRTIDRPIPDAPGSTNPGTVVNDTITVPASCPIQQIEFVEITFASDHTYPADLAITLVSPAGRQSVLASTRACGSGVDADIDPCRRPRYDAWQSGWRFGSVRHMGERAAGNWRLEVVDGTPEDQGQFRSWSLRFWGR